MPPPLDPRAPVTVITGWLGSGKTTLLNRLLGNPGGRRFAVLINELGEIGVDDRLVEFRDEEIVELNNGCVCCSVRGDLVAALQRLQRRRRGGLFRRARPFDRVLIETTGVAEPAPLLRTFLLEPGVAGAYRPSSVVTLVDARSGGAALEERAAREQIAVADRIVLNKLDLVSDEEAAALAQRLAGMNPAAPVIRTAQAAVDPAEVLEAAEESARDRPAPAEADAPHDHDDIVSVCLREARPLDELQVQLWLGACVKVLGPRLLRYKGFLNLAGFEHRVVLQGVYDLFTAEQGEAWDRDERATELVFIGHGIEADFLRRGLAAAVADS